MIRTNLSDYRKKHGQKYPDLYPVEILRRVERPTTIIQDDKVMFNSYEKWPVDLEKCTKMRVGNKHGSGCGTCIKVCPWNKPNTMFHRFVNWNMRNIPIFRRFGAWGDDLLGYGKPKQENKWWLDLEFVDTEFKVPENID